MNTTFTFRRTARHGFTLMEIMIASALGLLVLGAMVGFLRQSLRVYYSDRLQLQLNADGRKIRSMIETDSIGATFFCLYDDFATASRATSDSNVLTADGSVGHCLVLFFTHPDTAADNKARLDRVVTYYREITNTTENSGPVHRKAVDIPSGTAVYVETDKLYTILRDYLPASGLSSNPILVQVAPGVQATPRLFYKFSNNSVMIQTQILEEGNNQRVRNIFNFTVSPRG